MKFIKPNSVSGEILNLLDEANEKMVLVSPYCKFDKWYRLINKIKDLKNRNIPLEFYVREGETETKEQVKAIGIEPICIPNLHCKLYFNEKVAIITSMNILLSSEINSLELGYMTETSKEYEEVLEFYYTYLNKAGKAKVLDTSIEDKITQEISEIEETFDWISYLYSDLFDKIGNNKIFFDDNSLVIKTRQNTYSVFIANVNRRNILSISGILSGIEFDYTASIEKNIRIKNLDLELNNGGGKYYDMIYGNFKEPLQSNTIQNIKLSESQIIVEPIIDFILKVEDIKKYCYANRKALSNNI